MMPITHLDGGNIDVIDSHRRRVPAVVVVRVEPGIAYVTVDAAAAADWLEELQRDPSETLDCAIKSHSGQLHYCGAAHVGWV
jgi:hypothetical protein